MDSNCWQHVKEVKYIFWTQERAHAGYTEAFYGRQEGYFVLKGLFAAVEHETNKLVKLCTSKRPYNMHEYVPQEAYKRLKTAPSPCKSQLVQMYALYPREPSCRFLFSLQDKYTYFEYHLLSHSLFVVNILPYPDYMIKPLSHVVVCL